jgi:hypothetical protein
MYESSEAAWIDMPNYSPMDHNGAWEVSPEQYVSAFNLAPASCTGRCEAGGVARVWVAPHNGTISIRGRVLNARGGNGVNAVVNLVSGRNVSQIWPLSGGRQFVAGTNQLGFITDTDRVSVAAGDMIRFEIHANGQSADGTASWTPSVGYVDFPAYID